MSSLRHEAQGNASDSETLGAATRTILLAKIKEGEDAADIFSRLMGDEVEPRREFIQTNALYVANLDV